MSHPGVAGSNTYDHEFHLICRVALDGKEGDIPLETWARIVCALRYKQYHGCLDEHYDSQLGMNAFWAKLEMGRSCTPDDYLYPPFFKCCAELPLQGVCGFLDDPLVQPGEQFLTNELMFRKKCAADLQVVKVAPPSVVCKRLWEKGNDPQAKEIRGVAVAAFGIGDATSVRDV